MGIQALTICSQRTYITNSKEKNTDVTILNAILATKVSTNVKCPSMVFGWFKIGLVIDPLLVIHFLSDLYHYFWHDYTAHPMDITTTSERIVSVFTGQITFSNQAYKRSP
jgi:imidazoleglycerol phosphate synthase glutamine amidotransferase subunit HisH